MPSEMIVGALTLRYEDLTERPYEEGGGGREHRAERSSRPA